MALLFGSSRWSAIRRRPPPACAARGDGCARRGDSCAMTHDHIVSNAAVFALVIAIAAALLLLVFFTQELADQMPPALTGSPRKGEAMAKPKPLPYQAAVTAAGPLRSMALNARRVNRHGGRGVVGRGQHLSLASLCESKSWTLPDKVRFKSRPVG